MSKKTSINTYDTNQTVQTVNSHGITPLFGRTKTVELIYGLRRGTLYNLQAQGKVRSVLLKVNGKKSGVRLWDLASIADFIESQASPRISEITEKGAVCEK